MKIKFGKLLPGQVFSWNSQSFIKIFPINGTNAVDGDGKAGNFQDEVEVEAHDDQLKQNFNLEFELVNKVYLSQLEEDSAWLGYLEAAGVDNWEGFDFAHELRRDAEQGQSID